MLKTKCRPAVDDGNLPVKCTAVCKIAEIEEQRVCLLCLSDCEPHCS